MCIHVAIWVLRNNFSTLSVGIWTQNLSETEPSIYHTAFYYECTTYPCTKGTLDYQKYVMLFATEWILAALGVE